MTRINIGFSAQFEENLNFYSTGQADDAKLFLSKDNTMRFTTLQEQEHWEFEAGAASEAQNCFTEAQQVAFELGAKESVAINKAKALGLFVVVLEIPYFCRSTDALVGCYNRFVCAFPSREAAEEKIQKLYSKLSEYDSGDYSYSVIQPA